MFTRREHSNSLAKYPVESSLYKIDHFLSADCRIIDNHEGQEAYSQTDTDRPLPDLWRWTGAEVRTQHRAASYRAAP